MSKQDASEQVKFLVVCIRHSNNGKPDFAAVAEELSIVSKAAAQKRYERLLKAYGVNGGKPVSKAADDGEAASTPPATPSKRKAPRRAAAQASKKAKAVKGESDDEDIKPPKPVKKAESDDDSEMTEPPASDSNVEI